MIRLIEIHELRHIAIERALLWSLLLLRLLGLSLRLIVWKDIICRRTIQTSTDFEVEGNSLTQGIPPILLPLLWNGIVVSSSVHELAYIACFALVDIFLKLVWAT